MIQSTSTLLTPERKQALYQSACQQFQRWYPEHWDDGQGNCLYWAHVALGTLTQAGIHAVLQAGSMQWLMVPPELDDGVSPTHFSYLWQPTDPASKAALAAGGLPEMHVWVGLPETQEIVDFSTASFSRLARDRFGLTWKAPEPPLFLWGKPAELTLYHVNFEATVLALSLIWLAT